MQENRDVIRNRMLTTAAGLWGYPGVENDAAFDPMISMLLNVCAAEIEKIAREKSASQVALMEELARLLTPHAATGPKPAHAIASAIPMQTLTYVDEQQEWALVRKTADNITQQETVFSPAAKFLLSRCTVKYMAANNRLFQVTDQRYKQVVAQTLPAQRLPLNNLYIGLEVPAGLPELEELSLFFDCPRDQPLWEHLPHAQWSINNRPVTAQTGLSHHRPSPAAAFLNGIRIKYTDNDHYCQYVLHYYRQQFVTLHEVSLHDTAVPEALLAAFTGSVTKAIPAHVVWLQASFPYHVPPASLDNAIVLNNCFPVLNRRAHQFMYRLQPHLNILPLPCNDLFFDIKKISDEKGKVYDLHLDTTADKLPEDKVSLRTKGINRFDTRDAAELVLQLTETLKDEVAAYVSLGVDAVAGTLRELNAVIANLEEKTGHIKPQEPFSYLLMRGREDNATLFVECWSTTGAAANNIKPGITLEAVKGADIQDKKALLITPATGGSNRLSAEEKLLAYKQALLGSDRIVTAEDIRNHCFAELGNFISDVTIGHGVQHGSSGKEGLVRTIDIELTPSPDAMDTDWNTLLTGLHRKISFRAAGAYPYRVKLKGQPAFTAH